MDNYTKEERGGARVQQLIGDRTLSTDLSTDFSLPDYQPEVKRLLRVRATVHPADRYIGAGSAEFSGLMDYSILYSGNDGALYCTTQSGEYQFSVPMEMTSEFDLSEGILCDAETVAETVTGRVVAPRKLSLKCRLRARVRMYGNRILEEPIRTADATMQRLCGDTTSARIFLGTGETMQLGDEILIDAQTPDLRVICAEGQVFVTEATAGSGVVNCRGEVCLKLFIAQESGGVPTVQLRRIPFAQTVNTDGAEVNCECCAYGVCTNVSVTVEEGRILCEVSAQLQTRAQRNEAISFLRDVYSTEVLCENRENVYALPRALCCRNGNFSLNGTFSLEEVGIPANRAIVDVRATPVASATESENGRLYLVGRCRFHTILAGEEDMSVQEFEMPFRYEIDGVGDGKVSEYRATVEPISCRARVDGERISVDTELSVCISAMGEERVRMLTEARFGEKVDRSGSVYTICYPSSEDTLWSVAKRYHRSVSLIADINNLAGAPAADSVESLAGVSYLLV